MNKSLLEHNTIHPSAIIGPNVTMGKGNYVGPYSVFSGRVEIGDNNTFISHASVGLPAQHRATSHSHTRLEDYGTIKIGSNNIFREFITIHQPSKQLTSVGSNCFLMSYVHIPHDCLVEDNVTIANSCQIGGHSILMTGCNLGLSICVHQFSVIGSYCMVGMGSVVTRHLLPYNKYTGPGPKRLGINEVGLKRRGFDEAKIERVQLWSQSCTGEEVAPIVDEDVTMEASRYIEYCKNIHN
jgi:UDP-N-acetylglucosamine acyltransferase